MEFVDTHCHIQFSDYPFTADDVLARAAEHAVTRLISVGCTLPDSAAAVKFAARYPSVWAAVGLHPHESSRYVYDHHALQEFRTLATKPRVVAIGETGLDYYYNHSPKNDQARLLRFQLELALEHDLPIIFHVREAYDDFWEILKDFRGLRGVVHSFSAGRRELEQVLEHNLHIGLNGIMTFTKIDEQLAAASAVPLEMMVLETDSPYLTPIPYRGKMCEPYHTSVTAEFLAELRGESLETLAEATTANAVKLFGLS